MNFKEQLKNYVEYFNSSLNEYLCTLDTSSPTVIREAISYAVCDGGKRIRPVLMFSAAEMLGIGKEQVIKLAIALEMIHSYSLVHDDLPAMDNDDYRRGKLSTHKKFGEANGILAGDALLNLAMETALQTPCVTPEYFAAMKEIFKCSGYSGMIGGQVLDLQFEKSDAERTESNLLKIYENKTCKLIIAPLVVASRLAKNKYYDELYSLGYNLGLMFQFTDDILDVKGTLSSIGKTPHKDENSNKFTSVSMFGELGAQKMNENYYKKCVKILKGIPDSAFLQSLVEYIYSRNN